MTEPTTSTLERAAWVSTRIDVTVARVYELVNHPDSPLPAYRIGRSLRFDPAEVEQWLEGQRQPAHSASAEQ